MHGMQDFNSRLKAVERYAVERAGGPTRVAADTECRLDAGTISRATNVEHTNHLPADVIHVVERLAGEPIISRFLCDALCQKPAAESVRMLAGRTAEDAGRFVNSTIEALEDGKATRNETRRIDGYGLAVVSDIERVRQAVHAIQK